jgi:hypothetical protein
MRGAKFEPSRVHTRAGATSGVCVPECNRGKTSTGCLPRNGPAVGFRDWAFGHIGCMGGGTPNAGQIAGQEIDAINFCYAFNAC